MSGIAILLLAAMADTQVVRTADDLRAAMRATTDAAIIVQGRIELEGRGISTPPSSAIIDLVGDAGATIDFGTRTTPWGSAPEHGIEFRCEAAFIRGITLRNWEGSGSAIRSNVSESLHVDGCTLEDISTRAWPTKTGLRAVDATEVWFGNGVGGAGNIVVTGTTFRRVATSDVYAHCIYPNGGGCLTVTDCVFEASGQPFVTSLSRVVRLGGNVYRDNSMVPSAKRGAPEWAYWVNFGAAGNFTAIGETFINAAYRWPIRNDPDPARAYFNRNDYSGLRVADDAAGRGRWVAPAATQPGMDFDDWQRAGFDAGSKPPQ